MMMMITDGDFAGHDVDEYDDNHHNFVRLKWFVAYLDRALFYFLWPGRGGGGGAWLHLNAM